MDLLSKKELMKNLKHLLNKDLYLSNIRPENVKSGVHHLDQKTEGLKAGDLVAIGSRPGVGKTSMACNIALNIARKNYPVLYFTMEMSEADMSGSFIAIDGKIDRSVIQEASDLEKLDQIASSVKRLSTLPIFISTHSELTTMQIKEECREFMRVGPVGLVVVDYLQLLTDRDKNKALELKRFAQELSVPVLVCSQIDKTHKHCENVAEFADIMLTLHRESFFDPSANPNSAEIKLIKNKRGDLGSFFLQWHGESGRMGNL